MPTDHHAAHAPYIRAIAEAMTAASVEPSDWYLSDAETSEDGETMTLSAVFSWDGDASPELFPEGLLLCWDLDRKWQYAAMRRDGSNDWPTALPLPLWAAPADVAAAAAALLRNEPFGEFGVEWHDADVMAAVKAWVES